jgi:hypothetical protein
MDTVFYWRWRIVEVLVQFSRMEVSDELVQLPWNTAGVQTIGLLMA